MKIFHSFLIVFCSFISFGQNSYYFSAPLYSENVVNSVSSQHFGTYSDEQGRKYTFDESGVTVTTTIISSMSKESVRESSKYNVSDGWIHGVVEGDSIPCILENGYYFFGIRNTDVLIGTGSQNVLTKSSNGSAYYLNTFENGVYMPIKLIFSGKNLQMISIDYDITEQEFTGVANKKELKEGSQNLIILSPTISEMSSVEFYFVLPKKLRLNKK